MQKLFVGGPCAAREIELGAAELAAAAAEHQVPDLGALVVGRQGIAVRFGALAEVAAPGPEARFVHVESTDGGFTANVPLDQALAGALVLYGYEGGEVPAKLGGPFRLLFVDSEDCSINVKFLGRVEFLAEPGSHTARCADGPGERPSGL